VLGLIDELPLGVALAADEVVSVESELLVDPFNDVLPVALLPSVDAAPLAEAVPLPLTLPDVVAGVVAVELLAGFFAVFWRSPMARALALPSANTEIKNTGAILRIWVSFRFIVDREKVW